MRSRQVQRVACTSCGWSGGRADSPEVLARPCFKCAGTVEKVGAVFTEDRRWAGCRCGWYGEVTPNRLGAACTKCGAATGVAHVVLEDGTVLA